MNEIKIGDRIAFILKTNVSTKKCYLLGHGLYLGKILLSEESIKSIKNKKKRKLAELRQSVCTFLMDDGNIYYQWDGWWIGEERFKEVFINDFYNEGWKVINVDIKGRRK